MKCFVFCGLALVCAFGCVLLPDGWLKAGAAGLGVLLVICAEKARAAAERSDRKQPRGFDAEMEESLRKALMAQIARIHKGVHPSEIMRTINVCIMNEHGERMPDLEYRLLRTFAYCISEAYAKHYPDKAAAEGITEEKLFRDKLIQITDAKLGAMIDESRTSGPMPEASDYAAKTYETQVAEKESEGRSAA